MAGMQYFAAASSDAEYLRHRLEGSGNLQMRVLSLESEASFSPVFSLEAAFQPVAAHFDVDIVPKAGHWNVSAAHQSLLLDPWPLLLTKTD